VPSPEIGQEEHMALHELKKS
jgi:hypothetical protein